MITHAAVKIKDLRQNKEIIIPCHRHCDAFDILHSIGYQKNVDYQEIQQGFLDENDNFFDRVTAYKIAISCNQIYPNLEETSWDKNLYSEDLW